MLSVTLAVITCEPADRIVEKPVPTPSDPSMFELHAIFEVRLPSSASLADPLNVSEAPSVIDVPDAGPVISTVGAELLSDEAG